MRTYIGFVVELDHVVELVVGPHINKVGSISYLFEAHLSTWVSLAKNNILFIQFWQE